MKIRHLWMVINMASNPQWLFDSLTLKFITQPFKIALTIFCVVLILFGTSIITQTYFSKNDRLLSEEIAMLNSLQYPPLIKYQMEGTAYVQETINYKATKLTYSFLDMLFFDLTTIRKAWTAQSKEDYGYGLKTKFLIPHNQYLVQLDETLKLISIRVGHIVYVLAFTLVITIVMGIDGLVARQIRKSNAGRESSGLYHRAKYWRSGVVWLSILIYLASPFIISPILLFIPALLFAFLIRLQAVYLKKYL